MKVNSYIYAHLYKTHHSIHLHSLYFCNTHMHTHVKTHPYYKIKSKVKFSIIWHRKFLLENGHDSLNKNHLVFYTYFQILSPSESVNLHATPPSPHQSVYFWSVPCWLLSFLTLTSEHTPRTHSNQETKQFINFKTSSTRPNCIRIILHLLVFKDCISQNTCIIGFFENTSLIEKSSNLTKLIISHKESVINKEILVKI